MAEMSIKDNPLYREDIESVLKLNCNFSKLKGKSVLITGATGLIGSTMADMLVLLSEKFCLNLDLYLVSRKTEIRTEKKENVFIHSIKCDFSKESLIGKLPKNQHIDFIFHLASTTHPLAYSRHPVETILINMNGTHELLEFSARNSPCRFILASSVEIYGDDREHLPEGFSETDFGYLDCNTSRSSYNESKRLAETLCQAYKSEKNADVVIARFCRCYGPTLKKDDSKALSQFLLDAIAGKNIVLKSEGNQYFSYLYSADAASALIFLLLNGKNGEAYNVADEKSNIHLNELAKLVADFSRTEVLFELPSESEKKGYSKAMNAILNVQKINALGWQAQFGIEKGIRHTIEMMKEKK